MVEVGKFNEVRHGNGLKSPLIARVYGLADPQHLRHILLQEVPVLTQIL